MLLFAIWSGSQNYGIVISTLHQLVEKNIYQFMQSCEFSVPDLCVFAAHIDIRFQSFSKCFTKVEWVDSCFEKYKKTLDERNNFQNAHCFIARQYRHIYELSIYRVDSFRVVKLCYLNLNFINATWCKKFKKVPIKYFLRQIYTTEPEVAKY